MRRGREEPVDEAMDFYVKATGKDGVLVNMRPGDLRRCRERWQARADEKQRFHDKKDQTWEFFRIQAGLRPDARKEFERKFERKVMNGLYSNGNAGQKSLQEWTGELQAEAQATERLRRSWRTPAPNGADNGRSCGNEESSLQSAYLGTCN